MRKTALILGFLLATTLTVSAQTNTSPWTWQFQGGYNSSSKWLKDGWMGSTGIGYNFTDNFRLGLDLGYWQGRIKDADAHDHLWSFMINPEYDYNINNQNQVYVFAGLGFARRATANFLTAPGMWNHFDSQTKWAGDAGIGYRYFVNRAVGLTAQLQYTHMAFSQKLDTADARVGVIIRF
ncbi:MAG: outer membrane beta-barrel protein [Acidobacteriota bacterium]